VALAERRQPTLKLDAAAPEKHRQENKQSAFRDCVRGLSPQPFLQAEGQGCGRFKLKPSTCVSGNA